MSDLEDRLLKKNIPGKYSWWDRELKEDQHQQVGLKLNEEDSNIYSHLENIDDNDGGIRNKFSGHPQKKCHDEDSNLNNICSASTGIPGVKGVLADYQLHQEKKKRDAWIDRMEKEELMDRHTLGRKLQPGESSISLAATMKQAMREKLDCQQDHTDDDDDDDDDEIEGCKGDNSDDFIARYRRRRLTELKQVINLPDFIGVEDVDPDGFSNIVDATDPSVAVVVHLYETYVPACRSLLPIMEHLSRTCMRGTRFLSLKASRASTTLDLIALPSVLVYRAKTLIGNLTPVTLDLPPNFTPENVHNLLEGIIGTREVFQHKLENLSIIDSQGVDNDSDAELDEFCKDFTGNLGSYESMT